MTEDSVISLELNEHCQETTGREDQSVAEMRETGDKSRGEMMGEMREIGDRGEMLGEMRETEDRGEMVGEMIGTRDKGRGERVEERHHTEVVLRTRAETMPTEDTTMTGTGPNEDNDNSNSTHETKMITTTFEATVATNKVPNSKQITTVATEATTATMVATATATTTATDLSTMDRGDQMGFDLLKLTCLSQDSAILGYVFHHSASYCQILFGVSPLANSECACLRV
jgi:hypothetical protein